MSIDRASTTFSPVERDGPRTSREVVEVLAVHHALCRALHVVETHNRVEVDLAHRLLGHGASRAPIRCAESASVGAKIAHDMLVQKQVFRVRSTPRQNSLQCSPYLIFSFKAGHSSLRFPAIGRLRMVHSEASADGTPITLTTRGRSFDIGTTGGKKDIGRRRTMAPPTAGLAEKLCWIAVHTAAAAPRCWSSASSPWARSRAHRGVRRAAGRERRGRRRHANVRRQGHGRMDRTRVVPFVSAPCSRAASSRT